MKALIFGEFVDAFWRIFICALIFIRVENGLTELGSVLGRVQMNARIKAHLISTFSGRSESYNKKCTEQPPKMHQTWAQEYTRNEDLRHPRQSFIIQGSLHHPRQPA